MATFEEMLNGTVYKKPEKNPKNYSPDHLAEMSAEEFLSYIGVKFKKARNGKITVSEDIDCGEMALVRLPDLSRVTMTHKNAMFRCDKNGLTSLQGLPKGAHLISCRTNRLESLKDVTFNTSIVDAFNNSLKTFKDIKPGTIKETLYVDDLQYETFKEDCASVKFFDFPDNWSSRNGILHGITGKVLDHFLSTTQLHEQRSLEPQPQQPVLKFKFRP